MKTTRPYSGDSAGRYYNAFSAIIALLFLTGLSTTGYAQVNAYARVTAISGSTLTVSNVNTTYHTFTAGNQVIIMQMQDNVLGVDTTSNTAAFGAVSSIGNAGWYEIGTISSVTTSAGVPTAIVLTKTLKKTYTIAANSRVQVISFRSYGANYTISSAISPLAWDGNVGGVVAVQVTGTLTLSSSVTANGMGFRGGAVSNSYESGCEPSVYISSSANYAYKGEGIYAAATGAGFLKGRAKIVTGGGGGSDDNGGGAGGGNFTAGGDGGPGWTCTTTNASGGLGGVSLNTYSLGTRIYMGGGGGGGQQNNSLGSAGGNGGGIILLKANIIATSCTGTVSISANGASAATSGNDGAGGGGAAGTIVLQLNALSVPSSCPLTLEANGGDGGSVTNTNAHGGGGGGGQGAIYSSISLATASNVTAGTAGGAGGLNSSSAGATSAGSGTGVLNTGVTGTAMSALAASLTSFTAVKRDREVLINWSTVGESPNQVYNVQRSADAVSFANIGTVTGRGSSGGSYTYTDRSIVPGMRYYRLEMADPFVRSDYSATVAVNMDALQTSTLVAYPNPARGQFFIQVNGGSNDKYTLVITDLVGHPVYYNTYGAANSILSVSPGSILSPGTYLVKLTSSNNHTQFGKIMIQ